MSGWGYFFLVLLILVILLPACWIVYTRIRASRAGLPPPPWSSYLRPFSKSHLNEAPSSRIYPASRGPLDWIKEKLSSLRGGRGSGGGAYEPTHAGANRRGLAPDEAWDARVGAEADAYGAGGYYEEQELGLHPPPTGAGMGGHQSTAYTGASNTTAGAGSYQAGLHDYGDEMHAPPRGRSISRDDAFGGGGGGGGGPGMGMGMGRGGEDPFGDGAERSELRGVSPRPVAVASVEDGEEDYEDGGAAGLKAGGGGGGGGNRGGGDLHPTERKSMFRESV